jgi:hypothetical protein
LEGFGEAPGQAEQSAEDAANLILGAGSGAATPSVVGALSTVDENEAQGAGARGMGEDVDDIERLRRENEDLRLEAMMTDRVRKQYLYRMSTLCQAT